MKIQKIVHSTVVIEEAGVKVLFDPGVFSIAAENITGLNFIIITHKHADHFDISLLKKLLVSNPDVKVIANSDTGTELDKEGIAYELVDDGKSFDMNGVSLEAFGQQHAEIYKSIPLPENTSYLIAGRFFHPGDAYFICPKPVEILALPLSAPWGTIGHSLDYALALKPKKCFSIHDGMLSSRGPFDMIPKTVLTPTGIEYLDPDQSKEFSDFDGEI